MADEEQQEERQFNPVDLSKGGLPSGLGTKLDPEADAWQFPPPPPKGYYDLRVHAPTQGPLLRMGFLKDAQGNDWTPGSKPDTNSVVYIGNLECRVEHKKEEWNGAIVFPRGISTRIRRGADISTMAAFLSLCGFKIPEKEVTPLQLAKLLDKVCKKDPTPLIKGVYLDWQIRYQDVNEEWQTAYSSYDDFPDDGKGGKRHIVKVVKGKGMTSEERARLYVREWPKPGGKPRQETVSPTQEESAPPPPSSDEEELSL